LDKDEWDSHQMRAEEEERDRNQKQALSKKPPPAPPAQSDEEEAYIINLKRAPELRRHADAEDLRRYAAPTKREWHAGRIHDLACLRSDWPKTDKERRDILERWVSGRPIRASGGQEKWQRRRAAGGHENTDRAHQVVGGGDSNNSTPSSRAQGAAGGARDAHRSAVEEEDDPQVQQAAQVERRRLHAERPTRYRPAGAPWDYQTDQDEKHPPQKEIVPQHTSPSAAAGGSGDYLQFRRYLINNGRHDAKAQQEVVGGAQSMTLYIFSSGFQGQHLILTLEFDYNLSWQEALSKIAEQWQQLVPRHNKITDSKDPIVAISYTDAHALIIVNDSITYDLLQEYSRTHGHRVLVTIRPQSSLGTHRAVAGVAAGEERAHTSAGRQERARAPAAAQKTPSAAEPRVHDAAGRDGSAVAGPLQEKETDGGQGQTRLVLTIHYTTQHGSLRQEFSVVLDYSSGFIISGWYEKAVEKIIQ